MGTLTEICPCGARLDYSGDMPRMAAREWRAGHQHFATRTEPAATRIEIDAEQVRRAIARTARAVPRRRRPRRRWRFRVT